MSKERSGFLPMAIGLMLILLGFAMWQYVHFNMPTVPIDNSIDTTNSVVSPDQTEGWKTYTVPTTDGGIDVNGHSTVAKGFNIKYPPDFNPITPRSAGDEPGRFNIPIKNYFHTKLANEINLNITSSFAASNSWENRPSENEPGPLIYDVCPDDKTEHYLSPSGKISSSGGIFTKKEWKDVGAGQLYEIVHYTLVQDHTCYSVYLQIHSANDAGVYPDYNTPEKITAANAQNTTDKTAFFSLIDKVVATFTITK